VLRQVKMGKQKNRISMAKMKFFLKKILKMGK